MLFGYFFLLLYIIGGLTNIFNYLTEVINLNFNLSNSSLDNFNMQIFNLCLIVIFWLFFFKKPSYILNGVYNLNYSSNINNKSNTLLLFADKGKGKEVDNTGSCGSNNLQNNADSDVTNESAETDNTTSEMSPQEASDVQRAIRASTNPVLDSSGASTSSSSTDVSPVKRKHSEIEGDNIAPVNNTEIEIGIETYYDPGREKYAQWLADTENQLLKYAHAPTPYSAQLVDQMYPPKYRYINKSTGEPIDLEGVSDLGPLSKKMKLDSARDNVNSMPVTETAPVPEVTESLNSNTSETVPETGTGSETMPGSQVAESTDSGNNVSVSETGTGSETVPDSQVVESTDSGNNVSATSEADTENSIMQSQGILSRAYSSAQRLFENLSGGSNSGSKSDSNSDSFESNNDDGGDA